jgi:hypothetical protein
MARDRIFGSPAPRGDARRAALMVLGLAFGGVAAVAPGLRAQGTPPVAAATPQPVATSPQQDLLSQAQLEQLLAPIALFPDDLLMQMLMAATYPLEIVQAKRWLGQGQNGALRGDALVQALNAQSWDPSVKSLVPFPDVLGMMNDQLEWTQQVGDAVLGQQQDVMNAIQVLRGRAQAAGMLASGPQQTVSVTQNVTVAPAPGAVVAPPPQVITIAPTQPETLYVPAYDPNVVFGTWPHAGYPPAYFPPPVGWGLGSALLTGMAFAGGAAIVGSLWGWGSPNWGRGDINVNANRYNNINVNRNQISGNTWRHDTTHRQGVAYRNDQVRDRVGATRPGAGADRAAAREQFRGRVDQAQRGEGIGSRPGGGDRPGLGDRGPAGGDRPGLGDRGPGGPGAGARPGGGDRAPGAGLGDRGPGGGARPGLGDGGPAARPGGGDRPALPSTRPGGGQSLADRAPGGGVQRPSGGTAQRPAIQHTPAGRPQARPAPTRPAPQGLQGIGNGDRERAAAQRGAASRQGQPAARAQAQQRAAARPSGGGGGGGRAAHGGGGRGGRH